MRINELFVHKFDEELEAEDYLIIVGKNTIYFVENADTDETQEQLQELINKEGYNVPWVEDVTTDYFLRDSNDDYPNIITFTWKTNSNVLDYIVPSINFNIDIKLSKHFIDALKKLKQELDIEYVDVHEYTLNYNSDESESDESYDIDDIINNFTKDLKYRKLPELVYHGTSTASLREILKTGIVGFKETNRKKPNFTKIEHSRLFLTSSMLDARFYASNAAEKTKSFPVILEINSNGIDIDKIGFDYDFYTDYIGVGDEEFDEIHMAKLNKNEPAKPLTLQHLRDKYIGASYRKFSYDGRVMPKWIEHIYYNETNSNSEFDLYVRPNEFKYFLEMTDFFKDAYGYTHDDYCLNRDEYENHELEEEEENENNNYNMETIKKLGDFIKENAGELEINFDKIQDIMKDKLIKKFGMPVDEVDRYLDEALTDTQAIQLKVKQFVGTQHSAKRTNEEIADMLLNGFEDPKSVAPKNQDAVRANDIFKKKNVNDKNGVYTDQNVPNPLMGEMLKFEDFKKK